MVNQLPQGWKEEELGRHADIKRGSTITKKQVVPGNYPVVAGGKEAAYYHNEFNRQPPVITVSASGASAGYVNYWEVPIFASDCSTIEEKDLNIKYVYYFLKSRQQKLLDKQVGVAIPHVSPKDIYPLCIPYPTDRDEQDYIVKTLDAVAEMIKLRKEAIQLTKDLIPAIFQEMFGNFRGDEPIKKHVIVNPSKTSLNDNEDVSFLSMADISVDGYILSSQRRRYSDVRNGFSSFINDDVILAKITPCYENGKGAIVRDLINGVGFGSTEFYVLRCDKQYILPEFLFYLLRSDDFMALGKCHMKGAAGQKRLDKLFLQNFGITYPSLFQQEEFSKKVEQINQNLEVQRKDLDRLQELFNQLLQKAFTGELTRGASYGKH